MVRQAILFEDTIHDVVALISVRIVCFITKENSVSVDEVFVGVDS